MERDYKKQINQLQAFKERNKFSKEAWEDRGLNPSNPELCQKLTEIFAKCAENLIQAFKNKSSDEQLIFVLQHNLLNFKIDDYDTEEKEFIFDLFYELTTIVNINFNKDLNAWLYGEEIASAFNELKTIEILSQDCVKCHKKLETFVLLKDDSVPDYSWDIIKCNNCGEYNLLDKGPKIKEFRYGNYSMIKHFKKTEYTRDQVLEKLKEIRLQSNI